MQRAPMFGAFNAACAASRCFSDPACLGDATPIAWVLMPDHLHVLLQLGQRDSLANVVGRLKASSARAVNAVLRQRGAVWSRGFHDHAMRSDESMETIARYIIANPIRAGLVERAGDYPFWNTTFLCDADFLSMQETHKGDRGWFL